MSDAVGVCERVREAIGGEPVVFGDQSIQVTVSQGVGAAHEASTVDELIEMADQALYRAKENGRNRVEWMDGT
jgi:diguanylate cyclase (GGDEF)-like protein